MFNYVISDWILNSLSDKKRMYLGIENAGTVDILTTLFNIQNTLRNAIQIQNALHLQLLWWKISLNQAYFAYSFS